MFFTDTEDDRLIVSPENNQRLAITGQVFEAKIDLKFDFFKKNFEYNFYYLRPLVTQIGGVGQVVEENLEQFGYLMVILFMLSFVKIIQKKHLFEHMTFVMENFKPKLEVYREVIRRKRINCDQDAQLVQDLKTINQMLDEEKEILEEGGESSRKYVE